MPNLRATSLYLILLSGGISVLFGLLVDRASPAGTENYRAVYYGARCLIHGTDPYQPSEFLRIYNAESGKVPRDPLKKLLFLRATTVCVNLPTTLFLVAALAILPWEPSHLLWLLLIAVSLTVAALLAFDLAKAYAPRVSLLLICILLANSEVLFIVGNTAGLAVSLCVMAVWCFAKRRYGWLGVLALGVSLALKPHDSGLVWLFLVVAGGALRKRALQSMAFTILLAVPALLWVSHVAPNWPRDLSANLAATSARGDISDPGPQSISRSGSADVIIDLQTVVSVFRDDPRFYNLAAFAICGLMLSVLLITAIGRSGARTDLWFGLGAIAALSMLPSYHRPYDAKLMLLAVPASAMLWAQGGRLARAAVVLTGLSITLTGDLPLAVIAILVRNVNVSQMGLTEKIGTIWVLRPAPIALLCVAAFYMCVYVRSRIGTMTGLGIERTSEVTTSGKAFQSGQTLTAIPESRSATLTEG